MERTEHALVPQWLRCTGNAFGSSASTHQTDTSSMHSQRSRSIGSNTEKDRLQIMERSPLTNSRRSSSKSGSEKHPYSSFTRSHHNRNSAREKDKPVLDEREICDHSSLEPLESILTRGVENIGFRRSQASVTTRPGEVETRAIEDYIKTRQCSSNPNSIQTLAEEQQDVAGTSIVPSSGLSSAVQKLPVGNSGVFGGEKWTSALAEVPAVFVSNGVGYSHSQQNVAMTCPRGLNMAEALSQSPSQAYAALAPHLPDKSGRLEELVIKQSRQLIPMTPSMPKALILNSADKSKQPKIAVKSHEPSKSVQTQPHSPHLLNHSHAGKFLVLKPGRENTSISTGDANLKVRNGHVTNSPPTPTASMSPKSSMVSTLDGKVATFSANSRPNVEKKSLQSMLQSRNDFFNLVRRKSMPNNATSTPSNSALSVSSTDVEVTKKGRAPDNGVSIICNDNGHCCPEQFKNFADKGKKDLFFDGQLCPDQEEAAFLRSLGWEENGGEDEGLTEEEINAFYQEYMKRRPSLKVHINSPPKGSTLPAVSSLVSISSEIEG